MELRYWIAGFKALHDRARKGELTGEERKKYLALRDELAKAVCASQRLTAAPGQPPRQAMRIARAYQIDLDLAEGRQRVMSMNISIGGFGALLAHDPGKGAPIGFSLRVPGSPEPLIGRVRVIEVQKKTGNVFVSFAFNELGAAEAERLEMMLFDAVLQQFEGAQF